MEYLFINETRKRLPKKRMSLFLNHSIKKLNNKIPKTKNQLIIVFVSKNKIRQLNKQFRGKDKSTDILSFESFEEEVLGELILCWDVLVVQAKEHSLKIEQEVCYMLVHGILHLLGYDHEKDDKQAQQMYRLQDQIYNAYFKE